MALYKTGIAGSTRGTTPSPNVRGAQDQISTLKGQMVAARVIDIVLDENHPKFKNVGENDLYVLEAHGSCGCTVPEVTKEAIEPGESAPIDVKFDSNGKSGEVTKSVMITCNTAKIVETINIKASIKSK
jgi:hypothetical protein